MDPSGTFERSFRRRLTRGITLVFLLFAVAGGARYLTLGLYALASVNAVLLAVVLGSALLLRDRPGPFAHVLTCSLLLALIVDNSVTGGFYDPNFSWMCVVPLLAGTLLPGWAVALYGLLAGLATLAFFLVDELGPGVPDLIPPAEHAGQSLFNRMCLVAAVMALVGVLSYERSRSSRLRAGAVTAANAASRAKSEFLANVSHELRTPLTAILGLSELLMELSPEERARETADLDRIHSAASKLLTLINGVLDLSKIEAGKLEISPVPTDLRRLFGELSETLGLLVRGGNNEWVVELPDELGVAVVDGDRLGQIVTNLVGNAAKFTRDGRVWLRVSRGGGVIQVDVEDTGIGIPPEKLETVFESFVQADGSTTRRYGGSGLGLAIARRLARLMDGDISLASAVGVGSHFTVRVADHSPRSSPLV